MNERGGFDTGVQDSSGRWPDLPRAWSYSSLKEAEECPRRWMLRRASYPQIWARQGYPPRPIEVISPSAEGRLERHG